MLNLHGSDPYKIAANIPALHAYFPLIVCYQMAVYFGSLPHLQDQCEERIEIDSRQYI